MGDPVVDDNLDDSFEVDGVPVDHAGSGEGFDDDGEHEFMAHMAEYGEGQVIDSVGPSEDVEEYYQMESDNGGPGEFNDSAVEADDGSPQLQNEGENGNSVAAEAVAQSPVHHSNNARSNDDEPYLEIMVSEQGFDDVGEIEGEASSRGDSEFGRVEQPTVAVDRPSTSKRSGVDKKSTEESSSLPQGSSPGPSSSTASAAASQKKDKSNDRSRRSAAPAPSADNVVTSSEKPSTEERKVASSSSSTKDKGKSAYSSKTSKTDTKVADTHEAVAATAAEVKHVPSSSSSPEIAVTKPRSARDKEKEEKENKGSKAAVTTSKAVTTASPTEKTPPVKQISESPMEPVQSVSGVSPGKPDGAADHGGLVVSIRNLAEKTTANILKEKLAEIAPVLSCTIFLRKKDERYALVRFRTIDDCNICVEKFNNVELDGNIITVALAPKRNLPAVTPVTTELTSAEPTSGSSKRHHEESGRPKSEGKRTVRTTRTDPTDKKDDRRKTDRKDSNDKDKEGDKKDEKKSNGDRTRLTRVRSPVRAPPRSPERAKADKDKEKEKEKRPRSAHPPSDRPRITDAERETQRRDFEERRRILEWKRAQQDRMRREEDLLKRRSEVEGLRLEKERERLKLERERLEAERLALERQKHRDLQLLDRDRKRREDEERRQRIERERDREREREREKERERDRLRKAVDKRPIRDVRDDRMIKKRRSAEPHNFTRVDREPKRPVARGINAHYEQRGREASPTRRGSPPRRTAVSPVRKQFEGYGGASGSTANRFDNGRAHDADRSRPDRNSDRQFGNDFQQSGSRTTASFTRRPDGRGEHWNGGSYGTSVAPVTGNTWSSATIPAMVNPPASHVYTPSYQPVSANNNNQNNGEFYDRYSSTTTANAGYRPRY